VHFYRPYKNDNSQRQSKALRISLLPLGILLNSLRITREQRSPPDIPNTQIQHHKPLQSNSTPSVRHSTIPECINISFQSTGNFHAVSFNTFNEEVGIVDTLSAGDDFFAATKHVVRVGEFGIGWVGHGVEWTNFKGEFIEDV